MQKLFDCPFCDKKYTVKSSLYDHIEGNHNESLKNMSPAQVYFNHKNHSSDNFRNLTDCQHHACNLRIGPSVPL